MPWEINDFWGRNNIAGSIPLKSEQMKYCSFSWLICLHLNKNAILLPEISYSLGKMQIYFRSTNPISACFAMRTFCGFSQHEPCLYWVCCNLKWLQHVFCQLLLLTCRWNLYLWHLISRRLSKFISLHELPEIRPTIEIFMIVFN